MKATLTFDLPEDKNDFELATRGSAMFSALWDIQQKMRSLDKYGIPEYYGETKEEVVCRIREEINEIIGELLNGID